LVLGALGEALHALACALERCGREAEAEKFYQRAVATVREACGGELSDRAGRMLCDLGDMLVNLCRWDEARQVFERTLLVYQKSTTMVARHEEVGKVYRVLGDLYVKDKRSWGEAKEAYVMAFGIMSEAMGPSHPEVVRIKLRADVMSKMGGTQQQQQQQVKQMQMQQMQMQMQQQQQQQQLAVAKSADAEPTPHALGGHTLSQVGVKCQVSRTMNHKPRVTNKNPHTSITIQSLHPYNIYVYMYICIYI
jgi:tetratricopeptide (TPR) repeat protein